MQQKTNPIVKTFAILFAILFVVTAVTALLVFSSFNQAFDPEVYKQALVKSGVYDNLTVLVGEQMVYQLSRNTCMQNPTNCTEEQLASTPAYLGSVDASEWSTVSSHLIDPVWLQAQLESAIDQVFAFLKNPGQPLSVNISLVEFKARLGGEEGYQALLSLLNSLEPCTTGDLLNLTTSILKPADTGSLQLCRPDESVLKLGETAIRETLKTTANNLPDNTSGLVKITSGPLEKSLVTVQRTLQLLRMAALISPIVPLFLLLVVTLLVVRSLQGFLRWWGVPLAITGLLALLTAMLISPILRYLLLVRINTTGLAPGLLKAIKAIILQVADSFRDGLLVQAGILCVLGIVMTILSFITRPKTGSSPTE